MGVLPGFEDIKRKDKIKILSENLFIGSGGHGLREKQLYDILKRINYSDLDMFVYTLKKCVEHSQSSYFCLDDLSLDISEIDIFNFTKWYPFDAVWSESWEIDKNEIGCYIYGYFKDAPPSKDVNFLSENVIYIGETRSLTRNGMLGRRSDFKSTAKNPKVKNPYGNAIKFLEKYLTEDIHFLYQSYLPCPPHLCKSIEKKMIRMYRGKYHKVPYCNGV